MGKREDFHEGYFHWVSVAVLLGIGLRFNQIFAAAYDLVVRVSQGHPLVFVLSEIRKSIVAHMNNDY